MENTHSAQCFTGECTGVELMHPKVLSASLLVSACGNNPDFHLCLSVSPCLPQLDRFPVRSIVQMLDHHHINHLGKSDQARMKFTVPIKDRYHLIKYMTCQS